MNNYWYDHNPSLTLFYKSIVLLEKSYQTFIDDALLSLKYKPTEYLCDSELLLDKNKKSYSEDILISSFAFLTIKQRIILILKVNKYINFYLKSINTSKINRTSYQCICNMIERLNKEKELLESIQNKNKFNDFITDTILKIIVVQVFRQWNDLMSEDIHGYHGLIKTLKFIKNHN